MKKSVLPLDKKASRGAKPAAHKKPRAQAKRKQNASQASGHKRRTTVVAAAKPVSKRTWKAPARAAPRRPAKSIAKGQAPQLKAAVATSRKQAPAQKRPLPKRATQPVAKTAGRAAAPSSSTSPSPAPVLLAPRPIRPVFPENPVTLSWQAAVAKSLRGAVGNVRSLERRLRGALETGLAARGVVVLKDALTRQDRAQLIAATSPADATVVELKLRGVQRGVELSGQEFFETLVKLEALVALGYPQRAVLLVATNDSRYVQAAEGRQPPFSTAMGRVYTPGTKLTPARLPKEEKAVPFVLRGRYEFNWERVGSTGWWVLVLWTAPSMWAQAQAARKQANP